MHSQAELGNEVKQKSRRKDLLEIRLTWSHGCASLCAGLERLQ